MAASMWKLKDIGFTFQKINFLLQRGCILSRRNYLSGPGNQDDGSNPPNSSDSPLKTMPDNDFSSTPDQQDDDYVSPLIAAMRKFDKIQKAGEQEDKIQKEQKSKTIEQAPNREPDYKNKTFASLLRQSKLMQIGEISGSLVIGKIERIVDDDLYIDFGGKFNCVCRKPVVNPEDYEIGTEVKLMLKDLEMSDRFLNAAKDITLLEAEAVLLGLRKPGREKRRLRSNFDFDSDISKKTSDLWKLNQGMCVKMLLNCIKTCVGSL